MCVGCEERYVFVPNLAHFGNHFLPIMAHFDIPSLELNLNSTPALKGDWDVCECVTV